MRDPSVLSRPERRAKLVVSGVVALLCGVLYYAWFRSSGEVVADPSNGTFPSLVHMLGLTWLSLALVGTRRGTQVAAGLLLISLIAEWYVSVFDPLDAMMLLVGFCLGGLTGGYYLRKLPQTLFTFSVPLVSGCLFLSASFFIAGTSCSSGSCGNNQYPAQNPIYMDYQTLRSSVKVSEPRPLNDIGRVYVYQSAIFLNRKNQGIHVLDNTDPSNPLNVAFIEIPGNTELSIRDNYLYADSYIDLVTINISDPQNVWVENRATDVFPYDEYQSVPDNVYFDYIDLDQNRGVVVSYERK